MKTLALIGILFTGLIANAINSKSLSDKIKFASTEKANELLSQEDEFTNSWSQFDIDSRMHKKSSTKAELFQYISEQTREWSETEKKKILSISKTIDEQLQKNGFNIQFPGEIYFVKTTAKEEGGAAGYTRSKYIILKEDVFAQPTHSLKSLIIHELFHVLTRNNPKFKKEMYAIIGFQIMNSIEYPEELQAFRITNPDAPQTDSYIRLQIDGSPQECMMILYSRREYNGGDFFEYLNIGFLSLEGDKKKSIQYKNGKAIVYSFNEVDGFYEQVGKNTEYIIHPEEIMAENFVMAVLNDTNLESPEIVNEVKRVLRE